MVSRWRCWLRMATSGQLCRGVGPGPDGMPALGVRGGLREGAPWKRGQWGKERLQLAASQPLTPDSQQYSVRTQQRGCEAQRVGVDWPGPQGQGWRPPSSEEAFFLEELGVGALCGQDWRHSWVGRVWNCGSFPTCVRLWLGPGWDCGGALQAVTVPFLHRKA